MVDIPTCHLQLKMKDKTECSFLMDTTQNIKFSIKDFFSKYDQIRRKLLFGHIY